MENIGRIHRLKRARFSKHMNSMGMARRIRRVDVRDERREPSGSKNWIETGIKIESNEIGLRGNKFKYSPINMPGNSTTENGTEAG